MPFFPLFCVKSVCMDLNIGLVFDILMSRIGCEILELTSERIKFILTNCDVSLANALRRIMLAETPTLAPHLVNIYENTSVLHDQFLAQRIGLVPFESERVDEFKYPWNCDCTSQSMEDCQVCKSYFRLQVHNKEQAPIEVTSLDIEPVYPPMEVMGNQKKPVLPIELKASNQDNKRIGIPIVKLAKNQQINLRFNVEKGIGKMHAKWCPASLATFQPDPEIRIDDTIDISEQEQEQIKNSCPADVYELHEGTLEVVNLQKCIFCGQCQKKAESISMSRLKNYIRVGTKKDRFIFTVETVGTIPPAMIVKKSMEVLREKLSILQDFIN